LDYNRSPATFTAGIPLVSHGKKGKGRKDNKADTRSVLNAVNRDYCGETQRRKTGGRRLGSPKTSETDSPGFIHEVCSPVPLLPTSRELPSSLKVFPSIAGFDFWRQGPDKINFSGFHKNESPIFF